LSRDRAIRPFVVKVMSPRQMYTRPSHSIAELRGEPGLDAQVEGKRRASPERELRIIAKPTGRADVLAQSHCRGAANPVELSFVRCVVVAPLVDAQYVLMAADLELRGSGAR